MPLSWMMYLFVLALASRAGGDSATITPLNGPFLSFGIN